MGLKSYIAHVRTQDPAMKSAAEILLYPGFWALGYHRVAHWLYERKRFWLARWVSNRARRRTGIEIHPGAVIGAYFFIDHGSGVVVGETAVVGDYVTMYHGVTLGGAGNKPGKRHPTIGNHVMIGAHAQVLGGITVGDGARIGAGTVVTHDVPPDRTVRGDPGQVK